MLTYDMRKRRSSEPHILSGEDTDGRLHLTHALTENLNKRTSPAKAVNVQVPMNVEVPKVRS
jgi:hypothetical protein